MSDTDVIDNSTRFINVQTGEYPITLSGIKAKYKNIIWGTDTLSIVTFLGFAIVYQTPSPQGDVVTELPPVISNDRFVQVWESRQFTSEEREDALESLKVSTLNSLNYYLFEALKKGVPFNFGTEQAPNYQHIQLRDRDRANHGGMSIMNTRDPELIQPFRTLENINIFLTGEQVIQVTNASYNGYLGLMKKVWELKDAIRDSEDTSSVPVIPDTLEKFYTDILQWEWY